MSRAGVLRSLRTAVVASTLAGALGCSREVLIGTGEGGGGNAGTGTDEPFTSTSTSSGGDGFLPFPDTEGVDVVGCGMIQVACTSTLFSCDCQTLTACDGAKLEIRCIREADHVPCACLQDGNLLGECDSFEGFNDCSFAGCCAAIFPYTFE